MKYIEIYSFERNGAFPSNSTFGIFCEKKVFIQGRACFMPFTGIITGNYLKKIAFVDSSKLKFTTLCRSLNVV